jgi:hypothetical protein
LPLKPDSARAFRNSPASRQPHASSSIFNHLQPSTLCLRIPLKLQTESIQHNNSTPLISIMPLESSACSVTRVCVCWQVKLDCVRVTWFDRVDKASVTVIAAGALSRSDALFAAPLLAPQLTDCQVAPDPEAAGAHSIRRSFARSFAAWPGRGAAPHKSQRAASPLINCRHRTLYTRTHTPPLRSHTHTLTRPEQQTHPPSHSLNQSVLF